jgi:cell division septation protein DedD
MNLKGGAMASSLNSKRVFLMMFAGFGLVAALVFGILLALGVREATREIMFLIGSLVIVSVICIVLSFAFKGQAEELESEIQKATYKRLERDAEDMDDIPLPQNAPATEPDPDDVALPQNASHQGQAK